MTLFYRQNLATAKLTDGNGVERGTAGSASGARAALSLTYTF